MSRATDWALTMISYADSPVWKNITRTGLSGAVFVFVVFFALLVFITHDKPNSFAELSRLAAVESLVERATWSITGSEITRNMDDKALWNGEFYSDKTPLFTVMTAVPYFLLHELVGAEIETSSCTGNDPLCTYRWFSYLMVAIPAALMLALFYYVSRQLGVGAFSALMVTAALAFGTMILPFSTVYNSHIPGSVFLFVGFVGLILPGLSDQQRRIAMAISGFFAGLTIATDLPSVFLALALLILAVVRFRRFVWWFAGGMSIPLLLTAVFNYQMHQSIMPIYFRPGVYTWEGSPWIDAVAGRNTPEPKDWGLRIFNTTVGDHGIFVAWPIMLFAVVGLLGQVLNRASSYRLEATVILAAIVLHLASFLFAIDGFGGRAYGIRYLISFFPLLFFFALFFTPAGYSTTGRAGYWLCFALALAISCASTLEGAVQPWANWHPVFFLERMETRPYVRLTSPFIWRPHRPVEAEIGPGVFLAGYNLTPQRLGSGQKGLLSIFWRSDQMPLEAKVKVFVHVRDADDKNVIQADHWILEHFAAPSSRWERLVANDHIVRDDFSLSIPADLSPGAYRILVGLYHPDSLERLPVVNDQSGEDAVYIGDMLIW